MRNCFMKWQNCLGNIKFHVFVGKLFHAKLFGNWGYNEKAKLFGKVNFMPNSEIIWGNRFMPNCLGIGGIVNERKG